MKGKYRSAPEEHYSDANRYYQSSPHQPVKSPSPDKRAASIIVCTKSPELSEYRQVQQQLNCQYVQYQNAREKPFQMRTPTKYQNASNQKGQDTQPQTHEGRQYISESRTRNPKISIEVESINEVFDGVSRIRQLGRSQSSQLDYIKLLKSKEETIKELKQIIEMIKKNGSGWDEPEQGQKLREVKQKAHDLSMEVKELKIQNQHLLNVIQRNKKSSQDNSPQLKDQILQRQIKQLRQSLRLKQVELNDKSDAYDRKFYNQQEYINRVEGENQSLLRLLKQKQQSLGNSALSSKSAQKQKLSLVKIREQYNQNLKLMKDNFYGEIQEIENSYANQIDQIHQRVDRYSARISSLQNVRPKGQKSQIKEEQHREKIRQQQIQNLMLEKYSKYEQQLQQLRRNHDRLIQELLQANRESQTLKKTIKDREEDISRLKRQDSVDINELVEDRRFLSQKNNRLEIENLALRRQSEQLASVKTKQVQSMQKKVDQLAAQYKIKYNEQKMAFEATINKLKADLSEAESKRKQIVDYYEKDKIDTEQKVKMAIDIYNQQNTTLKAAINQKNNQLHFLNSEIQRLRHLESSSQENNVNRQQLQRVARQFEEARKKCQRLEEQLGHLSRQLFQLNRLLKDKDSQIARLQNDCNVFSIEKDSLIKKLNQSELHNNDLAVNISRKELERVELFKRVEVLERDLANHGHGYNQTINSLRQQVASLQHKNSQLGGQLFQKNQELQNQLGMITRLEKDLKQEISRKSINSQPLEEELKQLRKVVCECFMKLSGNSEKEIVEEYYRLNYNYEVKLEQNLKLMKQADDWKNQKSQMMRQKQILSQKVALLEQNNAIYERQLKQRRSLYDQLLQQKNRIQRQILMSKKIKVEQNQIDQTYQNTIAQITARIDRLLDLQRQRWQQPRSEVRVLSPQRH